MNELMLLVSFILAINTVCAIGPSDPLLENVDARGTRYRYFQRHGACSRREKTWDRCNSVDDISIALKGAVKKFLLKKDEKLFVWVDPGGWYTKCGTGYQSDIWTNINDGQNMMEVHYYRKYGWYKGAILFQAWFCERPQPIKREFYQPIGAWVYKQSLTVGKSSFTISSGFEENYSKEETKSMESSFTKSLTTEVSVSGGGTGVPVPSPAAVAGTAGISGSVSATISKSTTEGFARTVGEAFTKGTENECSTDIIGSNLPARVYVWKVVQWDNLSKEAITVETCDYKVRWRLCQETPPNCVPWECSDELCTTCQEGGHIIDPYRKTGPACDQPPEVIIYNPATDKRHVSSGKDASVLKEKEGPGGVVGVVVGNVADAWCAEKDATLTIDLGASSLVVGVATQGHPKQDKWVTKFKVYYKNGYTKDARWQYSGTNEEGSYYNGNEDRNTIVNNYFPKPFYATHIMIVMAEGTWCMRAAVWKSNPAFNKNAVAKFSLKGSKILKYGIGFVCDQKFDIYDAELACNLMGLGGVDDYEYAVDVTGGTGLIDRPNWTLSEMVCQPWAESLTQCKYSNSPNCQGEQGIAIVCRTFTNSVGCFDNTMQLVVGGAREEFPNSYEGVLRCRRMCQIHSKTHFGMQCPTEKTFSCACAYAATMDRTKRRSDLMCTGSGANAKCPGPFRVSGPSGSYYLGGEDLVSVYIVGAEFVDAKDEVYESKEAYAARHKHMAPPLDRHLDKRVQKYDTTPGFCIDAAGVDLGRAVKHTGHSKDKCFFDCSVDRLVTACSYNIVLKQCIAYTGDVIIGNGDDTSRCWIKPTTGEYKAIVSGSCTSRGLYWIDTQQDCYNAGVELKVVHTYNGKPPPQGNRARNCCSAGGLSYLHFNPQSSGTLGGYAIFQTASASVPMICRTEPSGLYNVVRSGTCTSNNLHWITSQRECGEAGTHVGVIHTYDGKPHSALNRARNCCSAGGLSYLHFNPEISGTIRGYNVVQTASTSVPMICRTEPYKRKCNVVLDGARAYVCPDGFTASGGFCVVNTKTTKCSYSKSCDPRKYVLPNGDKWPHNRWAVPTKPGIWSSGGSSVLYSDGIFKTNGLPLADAGCDYSQYTEVLVAKNKYCNTAPLLFQDVSNGKADCEAKCNNNVNCKYYSIWDSNYCVLNARCASYAPNGQHKIWTYTRNTGASEFYQGTLGTICQPGSELSLVECTKAISDFALPEISWWKGSYTAIPKGCSYMPKAVSGYPHYNSATSGVGRADIQPICKRSLSAVLFKSVEVQLGEEEEVAAEMLLQEEEEVADSNDEEYLFKSFEVQLGEEEVAAEMLFQEDEEVADSNDEEQLADALLRMILAEN